MASELRYHIGPRCLVYFAQKADILVLLLAGDIKCGQQAAIGDVAKARGAGQIAKEAGVGRESLYKSLSEDGNTSFATILKVVHALGGRPTIQPS